MDWAAAGSIITAVATVVLVVVTWVNVCLVNRTLQSSFRPELVVKCPQIPLVLDPTMAREHWQRMVASHIMNEGAGPALKLELRLDGGEWRLVTKCLPRGGTAEPEELPAAERDGKKIELRCRDLSGKSQPPTSWVYRNEINDWDAVV